MSNDLSKEKSINFLIGLTFGLTLSAVTAFLYKTKSGRLLKKHLKNYQHDLKPYLKNLIKNIEPLPSKPSSSPSVKHSPKPTASAPKKKVFLKAGKPLVN